MVRHGAICAVLATAGCQGASPADPSPVGLTGTWAGTVPFGLPAGDWSSVTLTLTQSDEALSGTIGSRDGVGYPVRGTFDATATLTIDGLGTSLCPGVSLTADSFLPRRDHVIQMRGYANGRCPGTVAGTFTFRRQ